MPVTLNSVVPWGRSFDEYVRMFALTERDLDRVILDCAAGPSSFNAEMLRRGHRVISVDPICALSADQIRSHVEAVRQTMMDQVRRQPQQFNWEIIRSPEHLEQVRMSAMELFLQDYASDSAGDRYLAQSLPQLNFQDKEFDLALCSHFLFLYSDRLDGDFHVRAVGELLRIAAEVRIFPVTDRAGTPSPFLEIVQRRFATELVPVPYEFLRGANQMLIVC